MPEPQTRVVTVYPLEGGRDIDRTSVDRLRRTLAEQIQDICERNELEGRYIAHLYYPYSGKTYVNFFDAEPILPRPPIRVTVDYGRG